MALAPAKSENLGVVPDKANSVTRVDGAGAKVAGLLRKGESSECCALKGESSEQ